MIDLDERRKLESKLKPHQIPTKKYPFYLVYKYAFGGPYVVGFAKESVASKVQLEFLLKKEITFAVVTEGYPYEVS